VRLQADRVDDLSLTAADPCLGLETAVHAAQRSCHVAIEVLPTTES
jgi:hypothetical protein